MPIRRLNFQPFSDPSGILWRVRGTREAPAPRDSLNIRQTSLLSRNELESGTFTIVLHATSSFTYVSVIYGANFPSLRWLERPAQRSLRESQNGVRFPWKLRRVPIAWPRAIDMSKNIDIDGGTKTCERFDLEVLTGRPWLPSLEGRFSVDISLCRYAMASTWKAETAS